MFAFQMSKSTSNSKSTQAADSQKKEKEDLEFFFGKASPFSQHHPAKFEIDGVTYGCAEQYMMHQKAGRYEFVALDVYV